MKQIFLFLALIFFSMTGYAVDPDIMVLLDGESLKVYNLDISTSDNVYYSLSENEDAQLQKIKKSEILIIKKADGTKIDPNTAGSTSLSVAQAQDDRRANKPAYSPQIYHAIEDNFLDLKFNPTKGMTGYIGMKKRYYSYHPDMPNKEYLAKFILASDQEGGVLNFRLISEKDRTLAVARPRTEKEVKDLDWVAVKEIKYENPEYLIPDYVIIGDVKYSVVEIDPCAFVGKKKIKNVKFPETLRVIGPRAFEECRLNRIILPESLEIVGDMSFYRNLTDDFKEIYIPKGIKEIGTDCFRAVGLQLSPRQYTEAYLSSIPDFINTDNCTEFGIDDNAVESYERRFCK